MDASSSNSSPATLSSSSSPSSSRSSHFFHAAASDAYSLILKRRDTSKSKKRQERTKFNVTTWKQTTRGGLNQEDRAMLGRIYGNASSIFEFGLGESTYIANHVGVPRYSGIDSDTAWIRTVRNFTVKTSSHFRFYLADIGASGNWGRPQRPLHKAAYNYQVVPLLAEPQPFDVYMVDGRFRVGCLLMSFLHALSTRQNNEEDREIVVAKTITHQSPSSPTLLMHDCHRPYYHVADHLLDLVEYSDGKNLCANRRKNGTTDEQLYAMWKLEFRKTA
jgi:hypothetical protein